MAADEPQHDSRATPPAPLLVADGALEGDGRTPFATLVGADFSALSITPQRADLAPPVSRAALARMATFDAARRVDLADGHCVRDLGDAGAHREPWAGAVERIERLADAAHAHGDPVLALGGDHSVLWPLATSAARALRTRVDPGARMGLLQVDIHHDVRAMPRGPSNGSPVRGLVESGTVRGSDVVQVGIHPFANAAPLAAFCDEHGIERLSLQQVAELGVLGVLAHAHRVLDGCAGIYVSIDIDVLDRAAAPGTVGAAADGLSPAVLAELVAGACRDPRVLAVDIVEFDPRRDVAEITARAVARMAMAALSSLHERAAASRPAPTAAGAAG